MAEVAAFITTIGVSVCSASGAVAKAPGVRPKPASTSTSSLIRSSCAWRLVMAGDTPVSSLTISTTLRPATVAPCSWTYRFTPFIICWPVEAKGPDKGTTSPTFKSLAWDTPEAMAASANAASAHFSVCFKVVSFDVRPAPVAGPVRPTGSAAAVSAHDPGRALGKNASLCALGAPARGIVLARHLRIRG